MTNIHEASDVTRHHAAPWAETQTTLNETWTTLLALHANLKAALREANTRADAETLQAEKLAQLIPRLSDLRDYVESLGYKALDIEIRGRETRATAPRGTA